MKNKLHTTSRKAWGAMLREIENAKKCVYLEMYIFETDTTESYDFLRILMKKAAQGIKVIIVADAFGSKNLQKEAEKLRNVGIEILFFSHWLRHIHRKVLIIDERTAFIGGVNIGKRFENWNDLHMQVVGKIAKRILKSFSYTYEMSGGKDDAVLAWRKKKFSYKLKFWLVEHIPAKNIHTLRSHYTERIKNAKKNIRIATPYFAPPRWLISLLDDATRKGTEVEILIPEKCDSYLASRINLYYMEKFHSLRIKILLTDKMNHSKLLIIDDEEALVGSQNLDLLSFKLNTEAGIFFKNQKLVSNVLEAYNGWKKDSFLFVPNNYKKGALDYAIAILAKLFFPIL